MASKDLEKAANAASLKLLRQRTEKSSQGAIAVVKMGKSERRRGGDELTELQTCCVVLRGTNVWCERFAMAELRKVAGSAIFI